MIIFGDLHLTEESEETIFGQVLPCVREHILADDKIGVCVGDLWHLRYTVNVRLQNRLRDTFLEWDAAGVEALYIEPGNHDQINHEGRNALEVMQGLGGGMVRVSSQMGVAQGVGYLAPYRKDKLIWQQELRAAVKSEMYAPAVLFTHMGIIGADNNEGFPDVEGLQVNEIFALKDWQHVFSGHYHRPHMPADRVTYVGSPWQVTAKEAGQQKRLIRWDGKTVSSIPISCGRKFYTLRVTDKNIGQLDILMGQAKAQDDLRITVAPGVSTEAIGQKLIAAGFAKHTITPEVQVSEARLQVAEGASLEDYAGEYLKTKAGDLNKVSLARILDQILGVGV